MRELEADGGGDKFRTLLAIGSLFDAAAPPIVLLFVTLTTPLAAQPASDSTRTDSLGLSVLDTRRCCRASDVTWKKTRSYTARIPVMRMWAVISMA